MESYDAGLQLIENVGKARRKINSLSERHYQLTEMISKDPNNMDLKQERDDVEQELILFKNEEQVQKEALLTLEKDMDADYFKLLLQNLGATIGETAPFPHIVDSLNKEHNFHKAIECTSLAIKIKTYELNSLPEDDYTNREIVQSELKYYINDMQKSPISKNRYESMIMAKSQGRGM